jgi:hypothetical protein
MWDLLGDYHEYHEIYCFGDEKDIIDYEDLVWGTVDILSNPREHGRDEDTDGEKWPDYSIRYTMCKHILHKGKRVLNPYFPMMTVSDVCLRLYDDEYREYQGIEDSYPLVNNNGVIIGTRRYDYSDYTYGPTSLLHGWIHDELPELYGRIGKITMNSRRPMRWRNVKKEELESE